MAQKTAKSQSPHIPEEIVLNIYSRLPIKSQGRFKCVAKAWLSLPTTKSQHVTFLSYFYGNVHSISVNDDDSYKELPIPCAQSEEFSPVDDPLVPVEEPLVRLLGSREGLLLVSHGEDIFLWNPLTRACKKVLTYRYFRFMEDSLMSGICYDSSSDGYDVVIACGSDSPGFSRKRVEVSSLRRENWKEIKFPYEFTLRNSAPIVNGYLHWLVGRIREGEDFLPNKLVVRFDPAKSKFEEVPTPQPVIGVETNVILGLGALDGRLAIAQRDRESCSEAAIIKVWTMKQYGVRESWSVLFILQRSVVRTWYDVLEPLCFRKDGKVLFNVEGRQIVAYDTKEESPPDTLWDGGDIDFPVVYEESLMSPDDLVKSKKGCPGNNIGERDNARRL